MQKTQEEMSDSLDQTFWKNSSKPYSVPDPYLPNF
jgi:hypothetical protein